MTRGARLSYVSFFGGCFFFSSLSLSLSLSQYYNIYDRALRLPLRVRMRAHSGRTRFSSARLECAQAGAAALKTACAKG